jgi:hypothetical protein
VRGRYIIMALIGETVEVVPHYEAVVRRILACVHWEDLISTESFVICCCELTKKLKVN